VGREKHSISRKKRKEESSLGKNRSGLDQFVRARKMKSHTKAKLETGAVEVNCEEGLKDVPTQLRGVKRGQGYQAPLE